MSQVSIISHYVWVNWLMRCPKAPMWARTAIFACSGKLSPSLALWTISLGTASRGARCQLQSPSHVLSPRGHWSWTLMSFPSRLPACPEAFTQAGRWAHHPLPYVPMHESSVSAELNINEFGRTPQLPN